MINRLSTDAEVAEYIGDRFPDEDIIFPTGYPEAFIGISTDGAAIYDKDSMIATLVEADGMTWEEAMEFLEYNVYNTHMSDHITPIYIDRLTEGEIPLTEYPKPFIGISTEGAGVYDRGLIIDMLMEEEDMTLEKAEERMEELEYNTKAHTPYQVDPVYIDLI